MYNHHHHHNQKNNKSSLKANAFIQWPCRKQNTKTEFHYCIYFHAQKTKGPWIKNKTKQNKTNLQAALPRKL